VTSAKNQHPGGYLNLIELLKTTLTSQLETQLMEKLSKELDDFQNMMNLDIEKRLADFDKQIKNASLVAKNAS
jgi:hypothetical protein